VAQRPQANRAGKQVKIGSRPPPAVPERNPPHSGPQMQMDTEMMMTFGRLPEGAVDVERSRAAKTALDTRIAS
jgi:hypothetical protein